MTRRIAVMNQKGGVCKTSTSVNLADCLNKTHNKKVLVIDGDPSGNVGKMLGLKIKSHRLSDFLANDALFQDCITKITGRDGIDFILGDKATATAELMMAGFPAREKTLDIKMQNFDSIYDFVIIDCGPNISLINQNALCYADEVLIPATMDELSIMGVYTIMEQLSLSKKFFGKAPQLLGIIPTLFVDRLQSTKTYHEHLVSKFADKVFAPIHKTEVAQKALTKHLFVSDFAPDERLDLEYKELAKRVLEPLLHKNQIEAASSVLQNETQQQLQ